jgi:hypothetical protein
MRESSAGPQRSAIPSSTSDRKASCIGGLKWSFGFIVPDAGTNDVFVHFSSIEGSGYRQL